MRKLLVTASLFLALAQNASANNYYTIGLEGFHDNYREPTATVNEQANYGGIVAAYTSDNNNFFWTIEGNAAYGNDNYKSSDGSSHGIPQYEGEARLRVGADYHTGRSVFTPYVGIGARAFYDNSANTVTTLGFGGYDRTIVQIYAPIGASYKIPFGSSDWYVTPNAEVDPLLYGRVNSRLKNFTGYNTTETQHDGYGARGEIMIGQQTGPNTSWEFGPFVRYWNIQDSEVTVKQGQGWIEPKNNRTQVGLEAKMNF